MDTGTTSHIFYYYKNETNDLMSDDELIKFMKISYDSICQGSLELLSGRELNNLARTLRYAYKEKFTEDKTDLDEEDSLESAAALLHSALNVQALLCLSPTNNKAYAVSFL